MNDTNRDRLDELIDTALAGYSEAEPLTGMEERILRRVDGSPTPHWPWYRSPRLVVALASVLVLIGVAFLWRRATAVAPAVEKTQASVQRGTESVTPRRTANTIGPVRPPVRSAVDVRPKLSGRSPLPKKDRFPSDSPLTSEERALLMWSTRAPEQMRELRASLQERADRPVSIEPIRIEPLPGDGNE